MLEPSASGDLATPIQPRLVDLFLAFAGIAIIGFGGVLPCARWMLVEQRRWMTGSEFSDALAVAQFLPGGNILNLAVAVGQRYHGAAGSLAGVTGLLAGPFILVTSLTGLYFRYGQVPAVHGMLNGIAAAAAGLMLMTAAKMARPLLDRAFLLPLVFAVAAFLGVALAELSLVAVLIVLVPLSVGYAWWRLP
jgi:chromate transporter